MKFALHAFMIAGVLVGSDLYANGGAETQKLLRKASFHVMLNQAKVQNYNVAATIKREAYAARPQLVLANLR